MGQKTYFWGNNDFLGKAVLSFCRSVGVALNPGFAHGCSPVTMTDVALHRLAQIGVKNKEDCDAILADNRPMHKGKLFTLHWLGLNYRKQHGDGFCADLFKTDCLIDMINLAGSHVTFYDLATGVPFGFHPRRIITSSLSTLISDALHSKHLECPLKAGRPYFCTGATRNENSLCVFVTNEGATPSSGLDGSGECILDLFEMDTQITSRP